MPLDVFSTREENFQDLIVNRNMDALALNEIKQKGREKTLPRRVDPMYILILIKIQS